MLPDKTSENEKRTAIAKLAESHKLDRFYYLSLIEAYAVKFGRDPNLEVWHMDFMDIFVFLTKWKEDAEYFDRYREIEKILTPTQ